MIVFRKYVCFPYYCFMRLFSQPSSILYIKPVGFCLEKNAKREENLRQFFLDISQLSHCGIQNTFVNFSSFINELKWVISTDVFADLDIYWHV